MTALGPCDRTSIDLIGVRSLLGRREDLCIIRTYVESNGAGLEQRLSSLQAQIDDLRHPATDDVSPLERRLATLTEYTDGILKRWAATADRHARAVSQLESHLREIGDVGHRLQQDAAQRLDDLERVVQQEWSALRDMHEAPVRQLVEQAATLTEVCVATANSAQHGFDRAEGRLAALESDFHRTTAELTREMQVLLTEVRQLSASGPRQLTGDAPSWPLEGVTRLHQQLRESSTGPRALHPAALDALDAPGADATAPPVDAGPVAAPEQIQPAAVPAAAAQQRASSIGVMVTAIAIVVIVGAVVVWRLQRDVRAASQQAEQSQAQSRIAEQASRTAAEKQAAADQQLVVAHDLASRAQTIGDVLAAPDLVRYSLTNTGSLPAASGQVLWSRSRGFVFSASGLPAPPADARYQIWLLTRGGPVSAATFVPDDGGRVTVTTALSIPRAVIGAIVTTERTNGASTPTSDPVLARFPVTPSP